jgi:hypothetical protein
LKKELSKFEKKLGALPIVVRRNSVDGRTCSPGEVTAANVAEKAFKQRGLILDPARISLRSVDGTSNDSGAELSFPLKSLGRFNALYAFNAASAWEAAGLQISADETAEASTVMVEHPLLTLSL